MGFVTIIVRAVSLSIILFSFALHAAELPHIRMENGTGQLIVKGQPFLILGGELGNSSAGTAAQADPNGAKAQDVLGQAVTEAILVANIETPADHAERPAFINQGYVKVL